MALSSWLRILMSVLLLAAIPFADAAAPVSPQFQKAIEQFQKKNYAASRDTLAALVRREPNNALYWFNLGTSQFMLREFSRAEKSFARVEALGSKLTPAARLYRGKALLARGDWAAARPLFQQVADDSKVPEGLRDQARHELLAGGGADAADPQAEEALKLYRRGKFKGALSAIDRRKSNDDYTLMLKALILIKLEREDEAQEILLKVERSAQTNSEIRELTANLIDRSRRDYGRPYWLFLETASGFDSNIRSSSEPSAGVPLLASVGTGLRLRAEDLWQWNLGYSGRLRESTGHPSLRILAHEAQVSYGRALGTDLWMFTLFAQHESWANRPTRLAKGGRMRLRGGHQSWEFGTDVEFSRDEAINNDYDYLSGTTTQARFYAGQVVFPLYGQVFIDFEREAIGDQHLSTGEVIPAASSGWGPGARLLWRIGATWNLDLSVTYFRREFKTTAQPGDKGRRDHEFSYGGRVTNEFGGGLTGYLALASITNRSTLGVDDVVDENYARTQILLGVIWDAL